MLRAGLQQPLEDGVAVKGSGLCLVNGIWGKKYCSALGYTRKRIGNPAVRVPGFNQGISTKIQKLLVALLTLTQHSQRQ